VSSTLQLAAIDLRVRDLTRSVEFYAQRLGFAVVRSSAPRADLAVSPGAPAILALTEDRAARPPPRDAAGLFHAALLLPSRAALGAWLRFAADRGVEFHGFSDHGVSEALYFADPDGNGLEFYCDRPRADWPFAADGELAMVTRPLDLPALLSASPAATSTPLADARWGHLHLRVTDLDRSEAFYRGALGVALTQGSYPGARFLAADGYHHHLGLNTWGQPRAPQPPAALGFAEATFARACPARSRRAGIAAAQALRDPDGIAVRIVAA
jgi:catechol 2,3-dioxygenase